MRRFLVNSAILTALMTRGTEAGVPPECGLWCRDPEGYCSEVPCLIWPGACRGNSDCCEGQLCHPACNGPTWCVCIGSPGDYDYACGTDCAGLCIDIPEPTGPRGYTIQDVGSFGGESAANGINNLSQVVGEASRRAFIWRPGDIRLTDITGANWTYARKINNAGQALINDAFLWEIGGGFLLAGQNAYASDLNDLGHAVGRVWNRDAQEDHGALWVDYSQPIDLNELTGEYLVPADINNHGRIVGSYRTPEGSRAFLLEDGVVTNLGTLDGHRSSAVAINDLGQIAGYIVVPQPSGVGHLEPVSWSDGQIDNLDARAGRPLRLPVTINNCGEVLTIFALYHPLFGGIYVNALFPAEELWFLLTVEDMNDYGEIVGWGDSPNAGARGFYMRPTPGDLYPDGNIDLRDVTLFAHHWDNKLCLRTDVNRDGVSNLRDFARFQIIFGSTTLLPKAKND